MVLELTFKTWYHACAKTASKDKRILESSNQFFAQLFCSYKQKSVDTDIVTSKCVGQSCGINTTQWSTGLAYFFRLVPYQMSNVSLSAKTCRP